MDPGLEFEIPGRDIKDTPFESQSYALLRRVRDLCGWGRPAFPGSQPVSLSTTNIGELGKSPYVACEKSDGVRYLLFAASGLIFLVDRKEAIRVIEMTLPVKGFQVGSITTQQATLLDGELVQDTLPDGTKHVCFLVYDAIAINRDVTVAKLNLMERLQTAYVEVIKPRLDFEEMCQPAVAEERKTRNNLPLYLKDFFEIWDIMAIRNATSRLPHLSDGIIFTPVALPYVPGTCRALLKWKPPELNTLDFASELLYALDTDGQPCVVAAKLLIGNRGLRRDSGCWIATGQGHWDEMLKRFESHHDCDGAIWECYFDPKAYTVIPTLEKRDVSAVVSRWQKFWLSKAGEKRSFVEASGNDGDRSKKKQKFIKKAIDDLTNVYGHNAIVESNEDIPGIGRLPLMSQGHFRGDVCPLAKTKDGLNYFDFSKAVVTQGGWVLERIRTDKTTPNDERVMARVKESIDAGIDFITLFDYIMTFRKSGQKPVYSHCRLPDYYAAHGSRTQTVSTHAHDAQTEQMKQALAEAIQRAQHISTMRPTTPLMQSTQVTPQHLPPSLIAPLPQHATAKDDDDDEDSSSDDGPVRKQSSDSSSDE